MTSSVSMDPVTFSIIWSGLIAAAGEAGIALTRTAYSPVVREGADLSTAVFDAGGNLVAQAEYSPGHLGSMAFAARRMLEDYPISELHPGDAIICNDPLIGSGHLPDIFMLSPIYLDETLLGFAINIAHQVDVGGAGSGSQTVVGVLDNYQEGLHLMPTRLYLRGELVRDVARIIESNVRLPELVLGDLRAQYSANLTAGRGIRELARSYGPPVLQAAMEQILTLSEQEMRQAISGLRSGTYRFEDRMDDVGPNTDPVVARVAVTIDKGTVTVDWEGSGPQRDAGMNCYLNYTRAYSIAAVKSVTLPELPQNEGIIRTIEVRVPPGSFFNPRWPAACGGRGVSAHRIYEVVMGALAQCAPGRVIAANSHFANPNIGGIDSRTGRRFVFWEQVIGGVGARPLKDGLEATSAPWNASNVPIEVQEINNPVLIECHSFVPDSGGSGKFRGACGIRKDVRILVDRTKLDNLTDRVRFRPYGLFGGKPGKPGMSVLNPGTAQERVLHSKGSYSLRVNDVVSWRTAGAGGYGDPLERDAHLVLRDVIAGMVSVEGAAQEYGVVIEPRRGIVNEGATRKLRAAMRRRQSAKRSRAASRSKH